MSVENLFVEPRVAPLPGIGARRIVQRNLAVYRRLWWVFATGLIEPVLYLAGIGFGVGSLVGTVAFDGQRLPYTAFVAPAMMASAAMNGVLFDSMFGLFFKLRYSKVYEAVLSTPIGVTDIALGEVAWALLRGTIYAAGFLLVMWLFGTIRSPLGILALPGSVLIGFCFACVGSAVTTFMRNFRDFDITMLVMMPIFLFSATFYPISIYPPALRIVVQLSPLTRSVDLLRSLTTGEVGPSIAVDVVYLLVLALIGLVVASRRLERQLLK
ncbi:MAG TPA: ABC transporter permease [Candidatus Dormibacteraeota bacterium]|nr:ABC transporter permease [Candidatus Dormibacteraeota bacterium]